MIFALLAACAPSAPVESKPLLEAAATPDQPAVPTVAPAGAPSPDTNAPAPLLQVADALLSVRPRTIQWDADRSSIQIEVSVLQRRTVTRTEPIHVGVTVVTESGAEVDLLVQTLFESTLENNSIIFASPLDERPAQVLIGAWGTKISPCKVDRPGCKAFGFVLDDSLAAFPPGLYAEGVRQRVMHDAPVVGHVGPLTPPIVAAAEDYASIFGKSPTFEPVAKGSAAPGLYVNDRTDLPFARELAASADLTATVEPRPEGATWDVLFVAP